MTITNTSKREKKVMDKEEKREENTDENWSTISEFVGLSSYELHHHHFASVCRDKTQECNKEPN